MWRQWNTAATRLNLSTNEQRLAGFERTLECLRHTAWVNHGDTVDRLLRSEAEVKRGSRGALVAPPHSSPVGLLGDASGNGDS